MAARKSCTHLTWSEAKAKSGISTNSKQKEIGKIKGETHGKLLAAKIVAKSAPSVEEQQTQNRQAMKQAKKDLQRQAQLDAQREATKERQRLEAVVKPHEQAIEKLQELATTFQTSRRRKKEGDVDEESGTSKGMTEEEMTVICESKQLQVDEMFALQAMYADTPDVFTISEDSKLEDLQMALEEWQEDPTITTKNVINHPPLRLGWKRSIVNPDDDDDDDWIAHCFLEIVLSSTYPMIMKEEEESPAPMEINVLWFLLTQKSLIVSEDKPFESWGILDESGLRDALFVQVREMIGLPCLYEVMDTWFSENLFQFISISSSSSSVPTRP